MRGACSPYLGPTKTNVFNKFSVRYFVRLVVEVVKERSASFTDDADSTSCNEEEPFEVIDEVESALHEVTLWK